MIMAAGTAEEADSTRDQQEQQKSPQPKHQGGDKPCCWLPCTVIHLATSVFYGAIPYAPISRFISSSTTVAMYSR
jgi:hypothetical protein